MQTGSLALSAVGDCAKQLGNTAWFYGTDFAAEDIAAVLDALDIPDVDFYGDSYGTFVGQVLAGLYPTRLRSIILDSAYPVRPPDPWFATDWAAAWSGIDISCDRSPSCSSLGGAATARMREIIDIVRAHPIKGQALKIIASIEEPQLIAKILSHLASVTAEQSQSELPLRKRGPPLQPSLL